MIESKKKLRARDALSVLVKGGHATFFTLTTPDVCDYREISLRWRSLRLYLLQDMRRRGLNPQYVMNFERHPGYLQKVVNKDTLDESIIRSDGIPHGWHIHGVMNCRIELSRYLVDMHRYGFGRVDVRPVTTGGVAEYLTKHALKAYRGISKKEREKSGVERVRLVCTSRGLPSLSDYRVQSAHLELSRYLMTLALMEAKRRGDKLTNAIALWKRCECYALLYHTPYYDEHDFACRKHDKIPNELNTREAGVLMSAESKILRLQASTKETLQWAPKSARVQNSESGSCAGVLGTRTMSRNFAASNADLAARATERGIYTRNTSDQARAELVVSGRVRNEPTEPARQTSAGARSVDNFSL